MRISISSACELSEACPFSNRAVRSRGTINIDPDIKEENVLQQYDILIAGPASLDINIDWQGHEVREVGGAVVASGFAAARCGARTAVCVKLRPDDADIGDRFAGSGADVYVVPSSRTCSIRNQYLSPDMDRRECTSLGVCDPFRPEDLPDVQAGIWQFAGLVRGDFDGPMFAAASKKGKVAVDAQCLLRRVEPDHTMAFHDWEEKRTWLPYIDFFKTDAAEAEILTGQTDRSEAARMLHGWGAKEVLITHDTEVLAYDGERVYTCPIKARDLSGRTGRGDTAFAGYITERRQAGIEEALRWCTALVSLKMETPGPYKGDRADVEAYLREFY